MKKLPTEIDYCWECPHHVTLVRGTIGNRCEMVMSCNIARFYGEESVLIGVVEGLTHPLLLTDYARITEELADIPDWCPLGDVE